MKTYILLQDDDGGVVGVDVGLDVFVRSSSRSQMGLRTPYGVRWGLGTGGGRDGYYIL